MVNFMSSVINPKLNFNLSEVAPFVSTNPIRVLFLGLQNTDAQTDQVLVQNIGYQGEEDSLFGSDSQLASMIRSFRLENKVTTIDAIPFNPATGGTAAPAVCSFTLTSLSGTDSITSFGSFDIFLLSSINNGTFSIPIVEGDTVDTVAQKVEAAVNASTLIPIDVTYTLPVTGEALITLTARQNGSHGNAFTIELTNDAPDGISLAINAGFSGGNDGNTTGIDPTPAFAQVENIRYNYVCYAENFDDSSIKDFLTPRYNYQNRIFDGYAMTMIQSADTATVTAITTSLNSVTNYVGAVKKLPANLSLMSGNSIPELNENMSSQLIAIMSALREPTATVSQYFVNPSLIGQINGGDYTTVIPFAGTILSNIALGNNRFQWTFQEQDVLNNNGAFFIGNNETNTNVVWGNLVSTAITRANGQPEVIYKFGNTIETASVVREYFFNNNKAQYAQTVLTLGETASQYQVNMASFNAFQSRLYRNLSLAPYYLVPASSESYSNFDINIKTTIDYNTGSIVVSFNNVTLNSQVREITATFQISLTYPT